MMLDRKKLLNVLDEENICSLRQKDLIEKLAKIIDFLWEPNFKNGTRNIRN